MKKLFNGKSTLEIRHIINIHYKRAITTFYLQNLYTTKLTIVTFVNALLAFLLQHCQNFWNLTMCIFFHELLVCTNHNRLYSK